MAFFERSYVSVFFFPPDVFFPPCFLCVLCALGDSAGGGGGGVHYVIGGKPLEGGYCCMLRFGECEQ